MTTIGLETLRGAGDSWRAGSIYYADLLHALRATYADNVRMLLVEALHGTRVPNELKPLGDGLVAYPELKRYTATWVMNHAMHRLLNHPVLPDRVLKQHGIDVLICGVLERRTTVPTLALLADFQHLYLPELFEAQEIAWRNGEYYKTAERATRVVLFSEAVRADYVAFAPAYADKACVLPPASHIPESVYERDPREILKTYSLPEKFVYLPNQFWQHKNHLLAFEAIRLAQMRGEAPFVVCSGSPGDNRNAGYFSQVLQSLSRLGVRNSVALLGNIPRADVFALIRQAAFVLNPSRFEGYGLALAEAHAIGKRVLASDLPAHREQNVPCSEYFDPNNADELATKMMALWKNASAGPDVALERDARHAQPERVRRYAEQWMELIKSSHERA